MRVIGITPINNDLKEEKSMKFLQKLGKALMLPVAVHPSDPAKSQQRKQIKLATNWPPAF